jgi:glutamate-1-semialdehyde 2,1-aminomutase
MSFNSEELFTYASQYLPGGVCSSARVHNSLGHPVYISRAEGSRVYDVDGNEYIDLFMSFGSAILGHGHPAIKDAVLKALDLGFPCAYEGEYQSRLAQKIAETVPCIEMVRFTLSGTETTSYAVKLARGYTGRSKIVKFEGHFHGFNDYLAFNYWPARGDMWPVLNPAVRGIPKSLQDDIVVLPFNDFERLEETLASMGEEIAAVILEPLNYNSGTIEPLPGYLQKLRDLTQQHGIVLIFDEILSNFRTGPGCIQAYYGVTPDLCTLGKVIGGGLALSAFGGKREIMSHIAPLGDVQHSGTYNGLWLPIMAGLAFMDIVVNQNFYTDYLPRCGRLYTGINEIMQRIGFPGRVNGVGARCSFLFGPLAEQERLINYQDFARNNLAMALSFYQTALDYGLYLHSAHHHGISAMHSDKDIDDTLERIEDVVKDLKHRGVDKTNTSIEYVKLF